METSSPHTFIKPLSLHTSMETLGSEFPCRRGFVQTSMPLDMAHFGAPPCLELSACRNGFPLHRIKDASSRQVTFCKRRNRLFRKAYELSVLCEAEVAIIVFSPSGKLSEFASSSMSHIIKRYQGLQPQMPSNNLLIQDVERWKNEAISLSNKLKCLQDFQRCVFEKNNMPLSINEAQRLESMVEYALDKIRRRKEEILYKESKVLKEKLIQIMSMKECLSNVLSGSKKFSYHQDTVSTKLQLGMDVLQCTQEEKNSYSSKNLFDAECVFN